MSKYGVRVGLSVLGLLALALAAVWLGRDKAPPEIRVLAWVGYDEPDLNEALRAATGIRATYKTFVGGDQMFALLTQSRDEYDVVVVDPEYISKLHQLKRLRELDSSAFDFASYAPPFRRFALCWPDGHLYSVLVRFGVNGLVYNSEKLSAEDVQSYGVLWDPRVKGKVGAVDWYLLTMGSISKAAGNAHPYDIDAAAFAALRDQLRSLRPQLSGLYATPPEVLGALANGSAWLFPTGGESLVFNLKKQGLPLDWTVPKEGGVMWIETLAIPSDAPHPQLAERYIRWMQTPEAQALLVRRKAYASNVPNSSAYALLSKEELGILKTQNEDDTTALVGKLAVRELPKQQLESDWQELWREFKADAP